MRVAIIGGGTIATLFIEHIRRGDLGGAQVVAVVGRSAASRGKPLANEHGIAYVTTLAGLLEQQPEVVVEAASHDAVREFGVALLEKGIALIVLSGGALCDDVLRGRLENAAHRTGALLYVPSGGIGALDALKAASLSGMDSVTISVAKPPAAWKGIEFVETLGVDMNSLKDATVLFDGTAREGVPHFPANVNIAAVLSLAGIGFDRTRLKVIADPALKDNTHHIEMRGKTGNISIKFENVPSPDNPKTSWLACYSALAALKQAKSAVRYGT
jgi:aspartate dehydrogenase